MPSVLPASGLKRQTPRSTSSADTSVYGAGARAPADEQFEPGEAESVLDIDEEYRQPERVVGGRSKAVLPRPRRRLARSLFVGDAPDLANPSRAEMRRDRKHSFRVYEPLPWCRVDAAAVPL